jgi:hypothetical protein
MLFWDTWPNVWKHQCGRGCELFDSTETFPVALWRFWPCKHEFHITAVSIVVETYSGTEGVASPPVTLNLVYRCQNNAA